MMRLSTRDVLMLTQLIVILPHVEHLPYWLTVLSVLVIFSQLTWVHQRIFAPAKSRQKVAQSLVFLAGIFGIFHSYHTLLGVEAGTAFLVMCLLGKLFEVNAWRDVYVVLTFGLFVVAAQFLFDQDLVTAIWAVLSTLGVLYAMARQNVADSEHLRHQYVAENDPHHRVTGSARRSFRVFALIIIQAVPLMIILFIFFPRIPPLWTIHLSKGHAQTGMSDSMSPGDISDLSQSSALAFRVIFPAGQTPPQPELYWRGLVLGTFDGRTWRATPDPQLKSVVWSNQPVSPWLVHSVTLNQRQMKPYQLIMEPTQQSWLFALNLPFSQDTQAGLTREYTLIAANDVVQQTTFQLFQLSAKTIDADLPNWLARDTLQLPADSNPKSRAFAAQLFTQMNRDPEKYANAVLTWIRRENFVYTLKPPPLDGDRIDQFLFGTRQGFCEHYASAFTFLMRAAGVPARVVIGYQGGQIGRDGKTLEVRQMDAHAWSEIWLAGRGWVRVDPTAAVAPERIERGMNALTAQDPAIFGNGVAGTFRYNQFRILGQAREWMDYARYLWQQKVVGFDQDSQTSFLFKMFGLRSQMMQIFVMFGAFISVLVVVVAVMWWRRRPVWHPLDAPLIQLSKRLEKQNLAREPEEGVLHWLMRVGRIPRYQVQAKTLAEIYSQARYAHDTHNVKVAKKALWQLVNHWSMRS